MSSDTQPSHSNNPINSNRSSQTDRIFVKITESPLDILEASNFAQDDSCGAVSLFVGTTRDTFQGKKVVRLEYEAYSAMAEKEMRKIGEILLKEPYCAKKVSLVHRVGHVPVGEASVIIAVSSPHRKESIDAMRFGINELKATVPIWKKEVYEDGDTSWKANCECGWSVADKDHDEEKDPNNSVIPKVESSPAISTSTKLSSEGDIHPGHTHHHNHHHHHQHQEQRQ